MDKHVVVVSIVFQEIGSILLLLLFLFICLFCFYRKRSSVGMFDAGEVHIIALNLAWHSNSTLNAHEIQSRRV